MPASPEALLALLEAPHWKTPGSTSVRAEGPTAKAMEGGAAVNLTVLDHVEVGRKRLAEAEALAASGSAYDRRRAETIRTTQAARSETLLGETARIRQTPCPACGCYGMLWQSTRNRAVCVNRHCAPGNAGQRSWQLAELMRAKTAKPRRVFRTVGDAAPSDCMDYETIARFFSALGEGERMSQTTVSRLVAAAKLPRWKTGRKIVVSLSDVLTAHAVKVVRNNPAEQDARSDVQPPACCGLGDLFRNPTSGARIEAARALCADCPLKTACLDQALTFDDQLDGIYGGLTAAERRDLKKEN